MHLITCITALYQTVGVVEMTKPTWCMVGKVRWGKVSWWWTRWCGSLSGHLGQAHTSCVFCSIYLRMVSWINLWVWDVGWDSSRERMQNYGHAECSTCLSEKKFTLRTFFVYILHMQSMLVWLVGPGSRAYCPSLYPSSCRLHWHRLLRIAVWCFQCYN